MLGKWQKPSPNHQLSLKYFNPNPDKNKDENDKDIVALPPNKKRRISPQRQQNEDKVSRQELYEISRAHKSESIHFLRVTKKFIIYVDHILPKQRINHTISRIHVFVQFYLMLSSLSYFFFF